jgi:hypothetical protein
MKRLAIIFTCAIITACSSVNVNVTQTASTAPVTSSAYIATQSAAVALLAAGLLAAAWYGGDGVNYGAGGAYPFRGFWTPPLDEARRVNAQNCTRPIEDSGANLRCR